MFKKILSYIFPIYLHKTESDVSKVLEVTLYNGELVLDSANTNYSYGSLQRILRFALKQIGFDKILQMQRILVLGVAGGSVIKTLVDEVGYCRKIVGVEIDPEVIEIAHKYFDLKNIPNLKIVINDAQVFVKNNSTKYDLIIIDIFQDKEMPSFLFQREFSEDIISLLDENGIVLFNTMKINHEDEKRNKDFKLNYCQNKFSIIEFNNVEGSNDLFIIYKKS